MNNDMNIDEIIDSLQNINYSTLGEKIRNDIEIYYTEFKKQFSFDENGDVLTNETRSEMISASYNMSLESLNNSLQYLEYSYTLILAINKIIKEYNLSSNEIKSEAMLLTNEFIESIVNNVNTNINTKLSDLLLKQMKES